MDARAIQEDQLVEGARRSTLEELTDWDALGRQGDQLLKRATPTVAAAIPSTTATRRESEDRLSN